MRTTLSLPDGTTDQTFFGKDALIKGRIHTMQRNLNIINN